MRAKRARNRWSTSRNQNGVERSSLRPAICTITRNDFDVAIAQPLHAIARKPGEFLMPLNGNDLLGNLSKNGGRVARTRSYLEDRVARFYARRVTHQRSEERRVGKAGASTSRSRWCPDQ